MSFYIFPSMSNQNFYWLFPWESRKNEMRYFNNSSLISFWYILNVNSVLNFKTTNMPFHVLHWEPYNCRIRRLKGSSLNFKTVQCTQTHFTVLVDFVATYQLLTTPNKQRLYEFRLPISQLYGAEWMKDLAILQIHWV